LHCPLSAVDNRKLQTDKFEAKRKFVGIAGVVAGVKFSSLRSSTAKFSRYYLKFTPLCRRLIVAAMEIGQGRWPPFRTSGFERVSEPGMVMVPRHHAAPRLQVAAHPCDPAGLNASHRSASLRPAIRGRADVHRALERAAGAPRGNRTTWPPSTIGRFDAGCHKFPGDHEIPHHRGGGFRTSFALPPERILAAVLALKNGCFIQH
jgi:hypothetical protein